MLFADEVGTDGAFRPEAAVGKVLLAGTEKTPYAVKGVLRRPPHHSHFHFDAIRPWVDAKALQKQAQRRNNQSLILSSSDSRASMRFSAAK